MLLQKGLAIRRDCSVTELAGANAIAVGARSAAAMNWRPAHFEGNQTSEGQRGPC